MKKFTLILLLSILCFSFLLAEPSKEKVTNNFFYFEFEATIPPPLIVPFFGLGYRYQNNHFGFDFPIEGISIYYYSIAKTTPSFLYYFKPTNDSSYYCGLGIGGAMIFEKSYKMVSELYPEIIVIGKQYKTKKNRNAFIHGSLNFPIYNFSHVQPYPVFNIKYGIAI